MYGCGCTGGTWGFPPSGLSPRDVRATAWGHSPSPPTRLRRENPPLGMFPGARDSRNATRGSETGSNPRLLLCTLCPWGPPHSAPL